MAGLIFFFFLLLLVRIIQFLFYVKCIAEPKTLKQMSDTGIYRKIYFTVLSMGRIVLNSKSRSIIFQKLKEKD